MAASRGGGSLVPLNQLMIVVGISMLFFPNFFLRSRGADSGLGLRGARRVPAGLYFLLLTLVPESPRWLLSKGRRQSAQAALSAVQSPADAQQEIEIIEANLVKQSRHFAVLLLLTDRLRRVMTFGFAFSFLQH